ncbi:hypothetical protein Sj15T_39880 [Sphingobium sp. TA15]|uniref:Uncharacterized protein n=1 Tax=Sphingobium indicum (strain DSM 16413 / CCM 7287 / MTCC 6362 / UT26 / NBRC 101211 / UT26S) TaxID=452662 RepID=D4Z766_SPHIU|nr:hypothetical protein [Sphingobium indicum]BAI98924.1 hypothetical protein SJA_C2-05610 [Sphingobium indicum UT26S]BDD68967.1 hypothetical protein Sj15T_39880 [Sphingobium sp. TA15]
MTGMSPSRRSGSWIAAIPLMLAAAGPAALAQSTILPEGMAIQLETRQDISSKSARVGDRIELAVARPVTIGGVTLIPAGSPAVGEVSRVRDNGLLGRSGKLDIKVSTVRTGGMDVPVRGQRSSQGKSGTLGAVGAGIVFLPLAVIVRGKDVKLPAGTLFEVYVDREVSLGPTAPPEPAVAAPPEGREAPGGIRTVDPNQALGS